MERIEGFLKRYARGPTCRAWVGARPNVRIGQLPRAISAIVGYPTADLKWFEKYKLNNIGRTDAASLLAFVATASVAHGPYTQPRVSYVQAALQALGDLEPEATFLTNTADWLGGLSRRSPPLGTATFEAGVLGYDANLAFIYWVEEED